MIISEGKKPKWITCCGVSSINELYKVEAEEFNKNIQLKVWDKLISLFILIIQRLRKIPSNIKSYPNTKIMLKITTRFALSSKCVLQDKFENWQKFLNITASRFTDKYSLIIKFENM